MICAGRAGTRVAGDLMKARLIRELTNVNNCGGSKMQCLTRKKYLQF